VRIHTSVRIEAGRDLVWAVLTDVDRMPLWMHDAREVSLDSREGLRVGARLRVPIRLVGVNLTDYLEVSVLDPPKRWALRHIGLVDGTIEWSLIEDETGDATEIHQHVEIEAPLGILGEFAMTAGRNALRRRFYHDLLRLERLCEADARRLR